MVRETHTHTYSTTDGEKKQVWNVFRLWELSKKLTTAEVDIKKFNKLLKSKTWFFDSPTMLEVSKHVERVMKADLRHPILLNPSGDICDGWHRLLKAYITGKKTIKVKLFYPAMPKPCRVVKERREFN